MWTIEQERDYRQTLALARRMEGFFGGTPPPGGGVIAATTPQHVREALVKNLRHLREMRVGTPQWCWMDQLKNTAQIAFQEHLLSLSYPTHRVWCHVTPCAPCVYFHQGGRSVFNISPAWRGFKRWRDVQHRILVRRRRHGEGWELLTAEVGNEQVGLFHETMVADPITDKLYFGINLAHARQNMEKARLEAVMENL